MSSIINDQKSEDVPALLNLIGDLEEVSEQFNRIGIGFDAGEIDFAGFELALLQLQDCQELLEEILDKRHGSVSGK